MGDVRSKQRGIYAITHIATGRQYIGSAVYFPSRWAQHRMDLRRGTHHSPYLQRSWNRHGAEDFSFDILEIVEDRQKLIEREQYYLDKRMQERGSLEYNVCPTAGNTLGRVYTPEGYKNIVAAARKRAAMGLTEAQKAHYERMRGQSWSEGQWAAYEREKLYGMTEKRRAGYERRKGRPRTAAEIARDERRKETPLSEKQVAYYASLRGKKQSPEAVAKRAEANRRRHAQRTPEEKAALYAKIGAAHRGKVISPEARLKMSLAKKGKPAPPATRANLAKGRYKGKVVSAEHRKAISESLKGKPASPGALAALAAGRQKRLAMYGHAPTSTTPLQPPPFQLSLFDVV